MPIRNNSAGIQTLANLRDISYCHSWTLNPNPRIIERYGVLSNVYKPSTAFGLGIREMAAKSNRQLPMMILSIF